MLALFVAASLAQPQPGQRVTRIDLVRSPRGSNLVIEFAKPIRRDSVPIVPAGRRLVLHLPGPVKAGVAGQREGMGAINSVRPRRDRIVLTLGRLARPFADRAVVRAKGTTWRLKMSDPTVERDLADMLLGTSKKKAKKPFDAFDESEKLTAKTAQKTKKEEAEPEEVIAEEPAKAAAGLAAIAAAARGDEAKPGAEGGQAGAGDVPPPITPGGDLGRPVRIVGGLGLLAIGLLGFVAWRRRQSPMEEAFGLKVVSRAKLDTKSSVAVLEVGGAVLIVGLSDQGPRLLARLDDGNTMDTDDASGAEVERLRALVGKNPADRLGAWVTAAQDQREQHTEAHVDQVVPSVPAPAAVGHNERADLQRRLAEIRRVCSD
jgi:flagellar biogenesis protein FliO